MSMKSTLIKDIRKPLQQESVVPKIDEDVTVQEVLSEIERENNIDVSKPVYQESFVQSNNDMSNQLLQQQLLQQQLLQQQLLNQQNLTQNNTMFNNIIEMIKNVFKRDNNLLILSIMLYLIFTYVDILRILKIDDYSIFESYPVLINIVTSVIFGLTLVLIKPLM